MNFMYLVCFVLIFACKRIINVAPFYRYDKRFLILYVDLRNIEFSTTFEGRSYMPRGLVCLKMLMAFLYLKMLEC